MIESSNVFEGNNSAKIIIDNTGGDPIFSSCKTDLQANINYRISFAAKSEDNIEIIATSSLSSSPFLIMALLMYQRPRIGLNIHSLLYMILL